MEIDFNGLRLNLANHYNDILRRIKQIDVDDDDLLTELNGMRRSILSLLCIYMDDDPGCKSLAEEVNLLSPYEDIEDE